MYYLYDLSVFVAERTLPTIYSKYNHIWPGTDHHSFNTQVSLSRIYSRTGMNCPFLFDRGIIPGLSGKFLWIQIVYFSSMVFPQASTKVLKCSNLSCSQCKYFSFLVIRIENVYFSSFSLILLAVFWLFLLYSGCSNCILHRLYM